MDLRAVSHQLPKRFGGAPPRRLPQKEGTLLILYMESMVRYSVIEESTLFMFMKLSDLAICHISPGSFSLALK